MTNLFKNSKRLLAFAVAFAVIAVSLFTGFSITTEAACADVDYDVFEGRTELVTKYDKNGDPDADQANSANWVLKEDGDGAPHRTWGFIDADIKLLDETKENSEANPYIIENAEQLFYIVKIAGKSTAGKYYKVKDGIKEFRLNPNVTADMDFEEAMEKIKTGGANWDASCAFQGNFDGNGVIISGMRTTVNHTYAGLFPRIKGDVSIKNVTVCNSYIYGKTAAAALIGNQDYVAAEGKVYTIRVENCAVYDCHIESSHSQTGAGAIAGYISNATNAGGNGWQNGNTIINNCYINLDEDHFISTTETSGTGSHGGVVGYMGSSVMNVTNCIIIGIRPYTARNLTGDKTTGNYGWQAAKATCYGNIYTTHPCDDAYNSTATTPNDFTGIAYTLTEDQMKGAAAVENMDLDWSVWMANADGFPELAMMHNGEITTVDNGDGTHTTSCECGLEGIAVAHDYVDGVCVCGAELNCAARKTIYWNGGTAAIATGSGTKADPYVIKTAEELAWLIQQKADVTAGKFYKIDDAIGAIVLQPDSLAAVVSLDSAAAVKAYFEANAGSAKSWPTVGWEGSCFAGDFDGNGVTVYGLYQVSSNNAGLFSTVDGGAAFHNIALKNSYLKSTAGNYQVGGIAAVTSSASYGAKINGAVWFDGCVVANNYMLNTADSHDRSGVIIGSSSDVVYMDNCLVYGNDATYGAGVDMAVWSCANNSVIVSADFVAPEGVEIVTDGAETPRYYNMIRNSIIFGADPYDVAQQLGTRFNDPRSFVNVLTDADTTEVAFASNTVFNATEEQLKKISVADLADIDLAAAFIKTASYPELKAFHDAEFKGDATAVGALGHAAACSCGLADSNVVPHNFVCDVETPEWDSYYCDVCDYVCEHEDGEEVTYEADCLTAEGYEFDCPVCGYHEENFEEVAGHNFTFHEAEAGADCLTAGTIAYNYCDACEKNYAADASATEPFANAIEDLEGDVGECVPAEGYEFDDDNHWTVCSVCEEVLETEAHNGEVTDNGDGTHSIVCDVCDYASDAAEHNYVCDDEVAEWDSYYCDVCGNVCEHEDGDMVEYEADCVTAEGYTFDCPICGYHEEDFSEVAGHNFTFNEAEVGADCQTAGTVAYNYCEVCEKNYAADASETEPFENEITDLAGEYGACVPKTDEETGDPVYEYNVDGHFNVCDVCGCMCGELAPHEYTDDFDTDCDVCGAVRAFSWTITVDVSGVYTITPNEAFIGDVADIVVYDANYDVVKYNEEKGGYPLVKGAEYTIEFKEFNPADIDGELAWNTEKVEGKLYPDTAEGEWYMDAIHYVTGSGIMSGYSNGKFGPTKNLQRQDFVLILSRLAGINEAEYDYDSSFKDAKDPNAYYKAALNWALKEGITTGYTSGSKKGKFGVGENISREQIVTFIYRYAQKIGVDVTVADDADERLAAQYKDFGKVSEFATDAIVWALENEVIKGMNETTINPQGNASRAQIAQIMYNIFLNDIF